MIDVIKMARTWCIDCEHHISCDDRYDIVCPVGVLRAFNKTKNDCPKFSKKNG